MRARRAERARLRPRVLDEEDETLRDHAGVLRALHVVVPLTLGTYLLP